MRCRGGWLLRRGMFLWLIMVIVLLACQLPQPPSCPPQPPRNVPDLPLLSPLLSPLAEQSPLSPPGEVHPPEVPPPAFHLLGVYDSPEASTWTLVTLVVGAGLLFVAVAVGVFFLIRGLPGRRRAPRPASSAETAPSLPEVAGAVDSGRLPEGTLLNEGRYLILGHAVDHTGAHVYEVKPTVTLDLCPYCLHRLAEEAGTTCPICERPLPAPRPEHPVLRAKIIPDAEDFDALRELVRACPNHPVVVPPMALFIETAFGPDLPFVLFPEVAQTLADLGAVPQPPERVLSWGISLARGLEGLHQRGLALTELRPAAVQVDGEVARWLCFEGLTRLVDPQTDQARAQITANVRALAALLTRATSGTPAPLPDAEAGSEAKSLISVASQFPGPAGRLLVRVMRTSGRLRAGDFAVALIEARAALLRARPVHYAIGAQTDVGRLRKVNEDSLLAMDLSAEAGAMSVVAVVDGVGGHAAGDVASQLTVAALTREVEALQADRAAGRVPDDPAWIAQAATAANASVLSERQAMGSDMGATLVMACLSGVHATVLNVGDSRAYWLRSSGIQQVTHDHSLVQRLVDIGQLTPAEARHHPQKSIIYRVMGDSPRLDYDLFDMDLASGDALLLCSDGLSDLVEDAVLWEVWRDAATQQAACERLVRLANEAGGYDNITVVIIAVE